MALALLPERLHAHAVDLEDRPATVFPAHGTMLTYGDLWARSGLGLAALQRLGVRSGDPVAVVMTTSPATVTTVLAVLRAGAVVVPLAPRGIIGVSDFETAHLVTATGVSRARLLVTDGQDIDALAALLRPLPEPPRIIAAKALLAGDAAGGAGPDAVVTADSPALLQFSSGSTATPKGVVISHANLAANLSGIWSRVGGTRDDCVLSWLPLYHDFGLVGSLFTTWYAGCVEWLLPPLAFVRDPLEWIRMLGQSGATMTGAPQFAFTLCARKRCATPDALGGVDLSALKVALNAGETVDWPMCGQFEQRFAAHGLRPGAVRPAYGLAENTVAVTIAAPGEAVRQVNGNGRSFVSCGRPIDGTTIRIGSGARRAGTIGEIQVRGLSTAQAYVSGDGEVTPALRDGWLSTGDLGMLVDDHLYVVGRIKEVFKFGGSVHSPVEVERHAAAALAADSVDATMGAFAYFSSETGRDEVVVLVEHVGPAVAADFQTRASLIRTAVGREMRLPLRAVHFVRRGSLPRTSSGKLKRTLLARLYSAGQLERVAQVLW